LLFNRCHLQFFYKIFFLTSISCCCFFTVKSQLTVSGTVFDSTKSIPVKDVVIKSSNGTSAITDSLGRYNIVTTDQDSLTFIYNNKPTAKFAVKQIPNIGDFEISLHIRLSEKFRTLKEVKVYSRNYRQDSTANREQYAKLFNYQKPGLGTSTDAYSGAAGLDLDELINVFRFKRNKQLKRMQERLLEQEQENYVNYRFNRNSVKRITGLDGKDLEIFMKEYRPDFEFTQSSSLVDFYQYILNASYDYKKKILMQGKTSDSLQQKTVSPKQSH
jgi:hypothetical protein